MELRVEIQWIVEKQDEILNQKAPNQTNYGAILTLESVELGDKRDRDRKLGQTF